MRTEKIYDVGDKVLLEMVVCKKEFDDRGNIKYKLKDERSKQMLGWNYFNEDLIPSSNKCKSKTTAKKSSTKKQTKSISSEKGDTK